MYSEEEALKIGREFKEIYYNDQRYEKYISGMGALQLRGMRHKILHPCTSGNFVIPVFLYEPLPRELELPKNYKGIPVVTKILGPAIALERGISPLEKEVVA